MFSFGSGILIGTRTDIAEATPVNFGLVQEVTIEESASVKEIYGQYQYPLVAARGTIKTTGKAKVARISGLAFANLFYGVTPSSGQLATSFAEAGAVPASSPYTVTVVNAATAVDDDGVVYAATGLPLTKVASAPTSGQYSVASGVYTFGSADAGKAEAGGDQSAARRDTDISSALLYDLPRSGRLIETQQLRIEQIEFSDEARRLHHA
jgi:hypothetical protein